MWTAGVILIDEETAMLDCEGLTYDVISDADVDKIVFIDCGSDCMAVITLLDEEADNNDSIEVEDDLITLVDLDACDPETIMPDDIDCKLNEPDVVKMPKFDDLETSDLDADFAVIELFDLEPTTINDDEAAVLDSDAKMELNNFNEKCIKLDDFLAM